jgi:hypothetical protein
LTLRFFSFILFFILNSPSNMWQAGISLYSVFSLFYWDFQCFFLPHFIFLLYSGSFFWITFGIFSYQQDCAFN